MRVNFNQDTFPCKIEKLTSNIDILGYSNEKNLYVFKIY